MNRCRHFQMQISRDLDGDLSAHDQAVLNAHLAACRACRAVKIEYSALRDLFRQSVQPYGMPRAVSVPFFRTGWKIAAVLALCLGLSAVYFSVRSHTVTTETMAFHFIDQAGSSFMDAPIGALAYYTHFAGRSVHTQFFSLSSASLASIKPALTDSLDCSYRSSLYQETGLIEQYYAFLQSGAEE